MINFILNTFFKRVEKNNKKIIVNTVSYSRFIKNIDSNNINVIEKTRMEKTSLDKYFNDFKGLFEFKNDSTYCEREFQRSLGLHHERETFRNSV